MEAAASLWSLRLGSWADNDDGVLVWTVKIATGRGTLTGVPAGNTERHWIECLHDLGLVVE